MRLATEATGVTEEERGEIALRFSVSSVSFVALLFFSEKITDRRGRCADHLRDMRRAAFLCPFPLEKAAKTTSASPLSQRSSRPRCLASSGKSRLGKRNKSSKLAIIRNHTPHRERNVELLQWRTHCRPVMIKAASRSRRRNRQSVEAGTGGGLSRPKSCCTGICLAAGQNSESPDYFVKAVSVNVPARTGATRIRTVAVIDVGATSIRMAIAEIQPEGATRRLESLTQAVQLGKDVFTTGEISRITIEECVSVFRSYRRKLDEYGISRQEEIRVVATSAVREAANRITFVDRVFVATGLFIETLDEAEVHRMIYRGVQPLLRAQPALFKSRTMIIEVGGGNTELLTLEQGNVDLVHSFRLGSLRLAQTLSSYRVPRSKARKIIDGEIHSQLEPFAEFLHSSSETNMVAMGGDVRFAAEEIMNEPVSDSKLMAIELKELAGFVDYVFSRSEEQLVTEFHLTYTEAETVGPALLANLRVAESLGVQKVLVCNVNLRDGLIRDIAEPRGSWSDDLQKQIVRSTWELAHRYDVDQDHARNVADLCRQLFRQLRKEHELEDRYETLLYVAAALHETGSYINISSMHKHSMYLIMNSTLFGLTGDDLQLVAMVARYHRRSMPKTTHQPYASMDRYRRVIVSKLAAILRIAIALDASRSQKIHQIECRRVRNRLILSVPSVDDLSMEQIAVRRSRLFFETIFGLEVLLRAQAKPSSSVESTQL